MPRPPFHARFLPFAFLLLITGAAPARAAIPAGSMQPGFAIKPKDYAIVRDGDIYHLFYIKDRLASLTCRDSGAVNSEELGHATSKDLYTWTIEAPVLRTGTRGFTHDQVWAPSVFKFGSNWFMFYTYVDNHTTPGQFKQRIRVAVSPDLYTWDPYDSFSEFDCTDIPWSWCAPGDITADVIRDATIVPEDGPQAPGFVMFYTTKPSSEAITSNVGGDPDTAHNTYVLGTATSAIAEPFTMSNPGALWITHKNYPGGDGKNVLESPTLLRSHITIGYPQTRRLWYMLYGAGNSYADYIACRAGWSNTLNASPRYVGWGYQGKLIRMSPYTTDPLQETAYYFQDRYGARIDYNDYITWFAPEFFVDTDGRKYFSTVHDQDCYSTIDVWQMRWPDPNQPWNFTLDQPLKITQLAWSQNAAFQGQPVTLKTYALNGASDELGSKRADLEAFASQDGGLTWLAEDPASIGLPAFVSLAGDLTNFVWHAQRPEGWDPGYDAWVYVRSKRFPNVRTPMFTIVGQSSNCPPNHWPPCIDESAGRSRTEGTPAASASLPARDELRLVAGGARPHLELRLAGPGQVRVTVFDLQGRSIRTLEDRGITAGVHDVWWDGLDDAGARVPRGMYFARLKTPAAESGTRVLLAR
jgi:hypothetical protein